jgi:hypothetical protein
MPASAAQVFGPTTVDPGFTSTGEKTLLTMSTTLPAGGQNIIIVTMAKKSTNLVAAAGTYRIYKGTTLLYESRISDEYLNYGGMRAKPVMLIAVDTSPAGNDTYYFKLNITAASSTTTFVHVQGIVIKVDTAVWGYNTTGVSIPPNATATVTSISTSFPANSKVAIVAVAYGQHDTMEAYVAISGGNIKLKRGTTVVSSNEFPCVSSKAVEPLWVSLAYLDTPSSSSQTYSIEVTNNSSFTFTFYAEIVAFTVADAAFLDTASVTLTSGSQVTVGNLSTSLIGSVVVIGLAAAVNTRSLDVIAFDAGGVVLQLNNLTTGQISNRVEWWIERVNYSGMSGILPLFRIDTNVTNPSYQIKMTALASGINGEAKILAFILRQPQAYTQTLTEMLGLLDRTMKASSIVKKDTCGLSDKYARSWAIYRTYYESLGLLDTYSRLWSIYRTYYERFGLLDSISAYKASYKLLVEAIGLADIMSRATSAIRSEPLRLSDRVSKAAYPTPFTEGLGILDSVAKLPSMFRYEGLELSDRTSKAISIPRLEMLDLADNVRKDVSTVLLDLIELLDILGVTRFIELLDLLGLTDTVSRSPSVIKPDFLGLMDAFSRTWSISRTYGEAVGLADTVSAVRLFFRYLDEMLGLSDTAIKVAQSIRTDNLGLLDAYSRIWTAHATYYETLGLLDTTTRGTYYFLVEALGLLDSTCKGTSHIILEKAGLTDYIQKASLLSRYDVLGLTDKISKLASTLRDDKIGMTDTISTLKAFFRYLDERIGLLDVLRKSTSMTLRDYITLIDRLLPYMQPRILTVIKTQPHYIVEIDKVSELISKLITPLSPDTHIASQEFPRYLAEKDKTSELRTKIKKQQT